MLDDVVSYSDELKQHNALIQLIQSIVDLREQDKYELYSTVKALLQVASPSF